MRRYTAVGVVALLLVGCTSQNAERNLLVACQGYASTLTTLAALRGSGKLTDEQVDTVNSLRPSLNAICEQDEYDDPKAALDIVQDGMFVLIQTERGAQ